jgi:hypothetical protein
VTNTGARITLCWSDREHRIVVSLLIPRENLAEDFPQSDKMELRTQKARLLSSRAFSF